MIKCRKNTANILLKLMRCEKGYPIDNQRNPDERPPISMASKPTRLVQMSFGIYNSPQGEDFSDNSQSPIGEVTRRRRRLNISGLFSTGIEALPLNLNACHVKHFLLIPTFDGRTTNLRRHMQLLGVKNSNRCRKYKEDEGLHFICDANIPP